MPGNVVAVMGDDLPVGLPDPHDSGHSSHGDRKIRRKNKMFIQTNCIK
jgi:hypothetical protein